MSSTLVDSVKSVFTDPVIAKFSVLLGETEANVHKAVHAAIPIVLTDILHKSYFPEPTGKVLDLSRQAAGSDFFGGLHELTTGPGGLLPGSTLLNKGTNYSKSLFASRTDTVISEVSRYAGISIPSSSFITGIVTFAALDAIGRHLANANTDAKGLSVWLQTHSDGIKASIPAGLQVKTALGIQHYPWEKSTTRRRNTALYVVIALVIVALIIFFAYRHSQDTPATAAVAPADTTTVVAAAPPVAVDTASARIQVTLPNGKVLDAYKGGTEAQLVNFLNDSHAPLDKKNGNWFDFTKIAFASNSSSLLLESEGQLNNIVAILDAFPKAKIKIGGYSDNTGDSADNVHLSQQRAENIFSKLKELGAKPRQLTGAEGYGPRYPVGDNGTAAGRAMNRRMSLDVKAK
jgi:OmpA-OmpF porin, OOP family